MDPSLEDLVSAIIKCDKQMYTESKEIMPHFDLAFKGKRMTSVPIVGMDRENKDVLAMFLRELVRKEKSEGDLLAIIFVTAINMTNLTSGKQEEGILIYLETVDKIKLKIITVDNGKIIKEDDWIDGEKFTGRFYKMGLFDSSQGMYV